MNRPAETSDAATRKKAGARARALALRDAIPPDERARRSEELCTRLTTCCAQALRPGALVAVYCAMGSEPDLATFVHEALERGCRVCVPCMMRAAEAAGAPDPTRPSATSARVRMTFFEVDRATFDAREAAFIAAPAKAIASCDPALAPLRAVDPCDIDVMAVPLVAFDDNGCRLGYGGGNYDRFLGNLRDDAIVMGIAFAEQRFDNLPVEAPRPCRSPASNSVEVEKASTSRSPTEQLPFTRKRSGRWF